ncbi:MAG TPA: aminoacetone oxidase family FAD-binding enzyme [Rikenellaceae bacterium]|nr:aminoacetone oxidase family FAD-binding enzyme [Rikenellaceae bacterium]
MELREVIVIGAGAAGMMAAITAAREGSKVTLIEKMEKAGRKIRITGKGRCNITNTKPWQEFSTHLHPNSRFLKHAFYSFDNTETIKFFEEIGLKTVIERGDRVFPLSGNASDVVDTLVNEINKLNIKVLYNTSVKDFFISEGKINSISAVSNSKTLRLIADAYIIASGGLSYPLTGSTGDGYTFAEKCGHKVTECFPSLTALMPVGYCNELIGLQLKNCEITLISGKDIVQKEMGDLDFTNNGIEGSIGYKISRKAVKTLISGGRCSVSIDLKPAIDIETLKKRVEKEILELKGPFTSLLLQKLLPSQAIRPFMEMNNLSSDINKLLRSLDILGLAEILKNWKMDIYSFTSYERAVITAGGVSLDEIISKNMKSRLVQNLWFAGEVIDLDGDTGGYNLQIAFSTGFLAGKSAATEK